MKPLHLRSRAPAGVLAAAMIMGSLLVGPRAAGSPRDVSALPDPVIKGAACQGRSGVTVVVDFRDLQNERGRRTNMIKVGCARGGAPDGLAAIVAAGFELLHRNGFVCRLDERPLPEQTDCASEGYWSYWHARRTSSWEYSGVGPASWQPPRGSLEGWAWNWYDEGEADPRVQPRELFGQADRVTRRH